MNRFVIPGNPVPKQRPRFFNGHAVTPKETRDAERNVQAVAKLARVQQTDKPVRLTTRFYRESAHHCDLDNLVKLVSDALNGIAWKDDRQVVWITAVKAIDRGNPRTEVEISEVDEGQAYAKGEGR